jgi:hypothetical protein
LSEGSFFLCIDPVAVYFLRTGYEGKFGLKRKEREVLENCTVGGFTIYIFQLILLR